MIPGFRFIVYITRKGHTTMGHLSISDPQGQSSPPLGQVRTKGGACEMKCVSPDAGDRFWNAFVQTRKGRYGYQRWDKGELHVAHAVGG